MLYRYRALAASGQQITDTIEADSVNEAAESLRASGLTVLGLQTAPDARPRRRVRGGGSRHLLLLTHQMQMLLESGASLVPALEAVEKQVGKTSFGDTLRQVRVAVENGGSLTEALEQHPRTFRPVFCTIVAAGEATATLPQAFGRLSLLIERQQQVRKTVTGAVLYPALLAMLCLGVIAVLVGFVLPRFRGLFDMLKTPLPGSTRFLFGISELLTSYWMVIAPLGVLPFILIYLILQQPALRRHLDAILIRTPWIGRMMARLLIARVLRIWAAMLRCHVSLTDTIDQSLHAITNQAVRKLVEDVQAAVGGGGRIGDVLNASYLVDPVVTAAISTGEENGKLTESVDFVSDWLDRENQQMVTVATRVLEPTLLAVMGAVVGAVAMSLFLPLFDMAAGGR